ncbi:uncharacterized protein JN550_000911 [Neoarthrinium moseri]|uniref:uncharacterized protein n=1 Tax=Neoarthrinium moseri TaxID=1658444 RepID=UPI001FDBDF56|nr:uncharacterized protein JN550_000911 [Neoarthrinium moseri]KAI1876839.1 hypothetical protein JN550_000911 [Neoarthrinium moseri]
MPTYLCHGFRWHRKSILYFIVLQNVEDAAPQWIIAPRSAVALLEALYELYDFIPPSALLDGNGTPTLTQNYGSQNAQNRNNDSYAEERRGRRENATDSKSRGASRKRNKSSSRLRRPDRRPQTPPAPPPPPPLPPEPVGDVAFNDWSPIKMLEEYDPLNESVMSGPWAYMADYVVRIDNSISPMEEMLRYEERIKADKLRAMSGPSDETGRKVNTIGSKKAGWLEKLRDKLQREEDIRWYVVVCGDEERRYSEDGDYDEDDLDAEDVTLSEDEEFEFRLPEFAPYDVPPLEVQPLRLRTSDQAPAQRQRQSFDDKPPAVPEKDFPKSVSPPNPLQNLHEVGKASIELSMRPKAKQSTTGLRRLFTRKQVENPT